MGAFVDKTLETFELMAVAITELRQRVEALEVIAGPRASAAIGPEALEVIAGPRASAAIGPEAMNPPTEVPPHSHTHPDETYRSHVVSVGESHYHL